MSLAEERLRPQTSIRYNTRMVQQQNIRRWATYLLVCGFLTQPVFAPPDPDKADFERIQGWMLSEDPLVRAKAANTFVALDASRTALKAKLATMILNEKQASFYPEVVTWLRSPWGAAAGASEESRKGLLRQLVAHISDSDASMAKLLLGVVKPERVGSFSPMAKREGEGENARVLQVDFDPTDFEIAGALRDSGALKKAGVSTVRYGTVDEGIPVSGDPFQFEFSQFPSWVLSNRKTALYPWLEGYRKGLTPTSSPTRRRITNEMLSFLADAPPSSALELRRVIRDSLVNRQSQSYFAGSKSVPAATLTLDMIDDSDLRLARDLDAAKDRWGEGELGLQDLDEVHMKNLREDGGKVNFPAANQVRKARGHSITEILDAKVVAGNFVPVQAGRPGLKRGAALRADSYSWHEKKKDENKEERPCRDPMAALNSKGRAERVMAGSR